MMDMSKYVQSKTSNQSRVMPSASQRQAIAQQAKVQLPKGGITRIQATNGAKQSQSSSMPPPPLPINPHSEGVSGRRDGNAFGLDYEDFDVYDESTKGSIVQVEGSQVDADTHPLRRQYEQPLNNDVSRFTNEDSEHDSEGLVEGEVEEDEEETSSTQKGILRLVNGLREHLPEVFTGDVDSYPTTTSGISEDEDRVPPPDDGLGHQNFTSRLQQKSAIAQTLWTNVANRPTDAKYSQTHRQQGRSSELGRLNNEALSRPVQHGLGDLLVREIPHYGSSAASIRKQQDIGDPNQPQPETSTQGMQLPFQQRNKSPVGSNTQHVLNESRAADDVRHGKGSSDYDGQVLFGMEYNDLVKQSFDENPRADLGAVSELFPTNSAQDIPARMKLAQKFDEDAQKLFFSSLTIDQWDEAGDWFLQQFGDVLDRLRTARRERRKIAGQYEDEVHSRHDTVESKKRGISEALSSMRSSGESVLPTPKKPKTTRDANTTSTE